MKFLILLSICIGFMSADFTIDTISSHIKRDIQLKVKGRNKGIIDSIYKNASYSPLWIGLENKNRSAKLIQALNNTKYNYKNKAFGQQSIQRLYFMLDTGSISAQKKIAVYARLDILLTSAYVQLIRFITQGDVDWDLVQAKLKRLKQSDDISAVWEMKKKKFPNTIDILSSIQRVAIFSYLNSIIPMKRRYLPLVKLLKDYRKMDNFPKIPYKAGILSLGDNNSRIEDVKKRLKITGDYPKNGTMSSRFNKDLLQALRRYQKRYLLKISGKLDRTTTYYLNQPLIKNIKAILVNLDKTKLYPLTFENEFVEVNIPEFNLRYYKNRNLISKKGVVVGRIDRPTPIFKNNIRYVVLNPTWTIPDNLIKRDLIHTLRKNPNYLKAHNIHAFKGKEEVEVSQEILDSYEHSKKRVPYRFVQFSGVTNALGRVKFMFPNKYAVYLHDTDNKSLLQRRYKIYSSGCMRLENPFELLYRLLPNYSKSKISNILKTNKPKEIRLPKSLPIHIVYYTVYVEDGLAHFKNDIYLYDKIIEESQSNNRKKYFHIPKDRMFKKPKGHH